jgi:hypothetical protein
MVSLLEEPEFKAMMQEIKADMSAQPKRVRDMEDKGAGAFYLKTRSRTHFVSGSIVS